MENNIVDHLDSGVGIHVDLNLYLDRQNWIHIAELLRKVETSVKIQLIKFKSSDWAIRFDADPAPEYPLTGVYWDEQRIRFIDKSPVDFTYFPDNRLDQNILLPRAHHEFLHWKDGLLCSELAEIKRSNLIDPCCDFIWEIATDYRAGINVNQTRLEDHINSHWNYATKQHIKNKLEAYRKTAQSIANDALLGSSLISFKCEGCIDASCCNTNYLEDLVQQSPDLF